MKEVCDTECGAVFFICTYKFYRSVWLMDMNRTVIRSV